MLLQIQDGTLSIGAQTVLAHFDFEIRGNEKIAIVGRNGCGKTTLLRLLAGELSLDRDDHSKAQGILTSRSLTTGLLCQQAFSDTTITVEEELLKSCPCPDKWDRERFTWEQEYDRLFTGFGFSKEDKRKRLSQFSGGEQTKIALIRLLLAHPDILLLDEPTSGLDPLMQNRFVELIEKEKKRGKTILLSSHIFEEVEKTCDRIGMIRKGKLVKEFTVDELRHSQLKTYKIEFAVSSDMEKMKEVYPDAVFKEDRRQMIVSINDGQINALIRQLAKCDVHFLKEEKHTLEEYFMQFYGGNQNV